MPTRLLHLSDIHFRGYGNGWDDDADYRGEVLRDVKRLVGNDPIDGILVGGDIAWSGQAEQFEDARAWMQQLTEVCGCPLSQVWMVPGNHDVDWARADGDISSHFRASMRACDDESIDRMLRRRLVEDPLGHVLIESLGQYNAFAKDWGCQTTAGAPQWTDGVLQVDGRTLQLCGLNSALTSDISDSKDEANRRLILGTRQCKIQRSPDTVHVLLCHHPPQWLRDWERVGPFMERAHLVLFGHEHTYSAAQIAPRQSVHVFAGAVGPEPGDACVPTFNLITLSIVSDDLEVTIAPRIWDTAKTRFEAHGDGPARYKVALDLESAGVAADASPPAGADSAPAARTATPLFGAGQRAVGTLGSEQTGLDLRSLGFRYLTSSQSNRLRIAVALGVVDKSEVQGTSELDSLFIEILRRIRDKDLIQELAKELDSGQ
jgi:hypothetical protein